MPKSTTLEAETKPKKEKVKASTKPSTDGKLMYALTVSVNDQVFNFQTDDILETLNSLGTTLTKISTKVIVLVTYNGKTVERVLLAQRAKELFHNKLTALIFAKNIALALNAKA